MALDSVSILTRYGVSVEDGEDATSKEVKSSKSRVMVIFM